MKKLPEYYFQPAEAKIQMWLATAPIGTEPKDTLKSEFWSHVTRKMETCCRITVLAEDGTWLQDLFCTAVVGSEVKMVQLGLWPLEDTTADIGELGESMSVQWAGPAHRFRVVRNADKVVLQANFRSRQDAQVWMLSQQRNQYA